MNDSKFWGLVVDVGKALIEFVEDNAGSDLIITYGGLARRLPYEFNPRNLDMPLGTLSDICKEIGLPLISTVVVNRDELMPGPGYFKYFFPTAKISDREGIFIKEYNRVKGCRDWTPLANELGI